MHKTRRGIRPVGERLYSPTTDVAADELSCRAGGWCPDAHGGPSCSRRMVPVSRGWRGGWACRQRGCSSDVVTGICHRCRRMKGCLTSQGRGWSLASPRKLPVERSRMSDDAARLQRVAPRSRCYSYRTDQLRDHITESTERQPLHG